MKLTRNKIGNLCPVLIAALAVALLIGPAFGDGDADFEAMIREAIQSSKKSDSDKTEKAASNETVKKPEAKKEMKVAPETEPQVASSFKVSRTEKPTPQTVDSGWTAMVPHAPTAPLPAQAASPKNAAAQKATPVAVVDKRMSVASEAKKPQETPKVPQASISIWDAVPVTVASTEGETANDAQSEKTAPTPWDPWGTVLSTKNEEEKPENGTSTPKVEEFEPASAKDGNTSEPSQEEDDSFDDAKMPLLVPTEEVSDDENENEAVENEDMTAKLQAVEEENKKEAEKKEVEEQVDSAKLAMKPEPVFGVTESGKIVVKENEKSKEDEEIKEPLKVDAPKKAEVENSKKEETAKEESQEKMKADSKEETVEEPETDAEEEAVEEEEEEEAEEQFPDFDDEAVEETTKPTLIDAGRVGDQHGKDKLKLMYDEIVNGLKMRNMSGRYGMWTNYAKSTLRGTSGLNTGSEVDGRCRLSWYTKLYSEPASSVFDAEEFSRQMHHGLKGNHRRIAETMGLIRQKLDVDARNDEGIKFNRCETPFEALNEVKRCLLEAQMAHGRALSTLSTVEQNELANNLVSTFSGQGCVNGHTIPNRTYGRRLCNIMNKMDKTGIHDAAEALIPLTNKALLKLLDEIPEDAFPKIMLGGQRVQRLSTSAGDIIIGGRENNIYDLDAPEMRDVVCVIDQGGNDIFREGTSNIHRPVLVVITLRGNDTFSGSKPGIQGGSVLGISMLISVEGENTYSAGDVAQGSSIGGAGMLFDFGGAGNYKGLRRVQGHALCGIGMLVSQGDGDDKFRAALWAQGFGAPGGFGVLEDTGGNNHYYCGGLYIDSYPEHPGYDGWGQGVGAGIRQVANGGIGMILSGKGDDVYEVDYFGHGGGYWLGTGIARDFGGNDIRHGTTKSAYNGGPRRESEWTRFANGFGCHYAVGYLFDDTGNDVYGGRIMGTGMAWDLALGYLCDFNGSDRFTATGGMTQGVGAEGSIGILFSYGGNDVFAGRNQAFAGSGITYHSPSNCGSNFSFVINYGGNDTYGSGAKNNSYVQRGSSGGFLIDRPTQKEAANEIAAFNKLVEQREKEIAAFDELQEKLKAEAAEKGRRYVQRQRRPLPLTQDQNKMVGAVPDFKSTPARTGAKDVNVK